MKAGEFDYSLPRELIAQKPAVPRDSSRLLVLADGVGHKRFSDLAGMLRKDDVLVINSSKVIPARIECEKTTGGRVTCFLVRRMTMTRYCALLFGKRLRPGMDIPLRGNSFRIIGERDRMFEIEFQTAPDLKRLGRMPLPPYIEKPCRPGQYQTVYAASEGSVAAPTAGLHFTRRILERIRRKGVHITEISLHVGLGTFLPVKTEEIEEHKMHAEEYCISRQAADTINRRKGRLFIVGTTTMRCLESAAEADGRIVPGLGETSIFIYPGYRFRSGAYYLLTNFHLPKSTLLMMVSAFAGKQKVMDAYATAVKMGYRFYSFGDAMLIKHVMP
jgi:S-adenosylmethionine:tRNA ribosyltransferase-isomerase